MRDRLIELIKKGIDKHESTVENYVHPIWEFVADYLLENGVIVPLTREEAEQALKGGVQE